MPAPTKAHAESDAFALLTEPGGGARLAREGSAFVSPSGERFETEGAIVRTLRNVDPDLARELEAQEAAIEEYTDPRLLMPRYERHVAEVAVVQLFSGARPEGTILDVGCGIGMLGRLYPDLGLIGLDASMPLLRRANTGYRLLVEGSAEALPFADGAFDVVVALNMLHHVIRPDAAVREFARVLRPGGTLVAVDPRKVAPVELAKWLLRSRAAAFAPTHKAFGVDEYESIVRCDGRFEIEESRRVGLVSLLGMGGLDATKLSRLVPDPERAVALFKKVDDALFSLPKVPSAGLNLALRAQRR